MEEKSIDINKILENHEKRLSKIEEVIFSKKVKVSKPADYTGLSGGIRLLIDNGFLNTPKSVNEIQNELTREGYHYPSKSTDKLLSVNFMQKKKILTRVKEGNGWKYVVRK
ncbi:MAG: hypothetical protein ABH874_06180 [Methanobacteriota archaeon]